MSTNDEVFSYSKKSADAKNLGNLIFPMDLIRCSRRLLFRLVNVWEKGFLKSA